MKLSASDRKLINFAKEISSFRKIERQILYKSGRLENDAEHSWHLAVLIITMGHKINSKANMERMLKLALVHDLPELYTGDVSLFDKKGRKDKYVKEAAAAKKLFKHLPAKEREEFTALVNEYNAHETVEAKIVRALDKIQPMVVNAQEKGHSWRNLSKVTVGMLDEHKLPAFENDEVTLRYYYALREEAVKGNYLYKENDIQEK